MASDYLPLGQLQPNPAATHLGAALGDLVSGLTRGFGTPGVYENTMTAQARADDAMAQARRDRANALIAEDRAAQRRADITGTLGSLGFDPAHAALINMQARSGDQFDLDKLSGYDTIGGFAAQKQRVDNLLGSNPNPQLDRRDVALLGNKPYTPYDVENGLIITPGDTLGAPPTMQMTPLGDADSALKHAQANSANALGDARRHTGLGQAPTPVPKPLPVGALRMMQDARQALSGVGGIDQSLDGALGELRSGELHLGPIQNMVSTVRNAIGASSENSRKFDVLRANLEKLRNDSLRLNKGVQTEGDAQRAWNELLSNLNDQQNVITQLERIRALNNRAQVLQQENMDAISGNYGRASPGVPASGLNPGAVEDGYRFLGGNPADPNSWEKL